MKKLIIILVSLIVLLPAFSFAQDDEIAPVHADFDSTMFGSVLMVMMDKDVYHENEDITFTVSLFNATEETMVFEFPGSLQIDYTIDDSYVYSENTTVTDTKATVTVAAQSEYTWEITHSVSDNSLKPGDHYLTARLVGNEEIATAFFYVAHKTKDLPDGLVLSVAADKDTYQPGEIIDATVTVTNTTDSDISFELAVNKPVKVAFDEQETWFDKYYERQVWKEVTVNAGESLDYSINIDTSGPMGKFPFDENGEICDGVVLVGRNNGFDDFMGDDDIFELDDSMITDEDGVIFSDSLFSGTKVMQPACSYFTAMLSPGEHEIHAGILGYSDWATEKVSISDEPKKVTLTCKIMSFSTDRDTLESTEDTHVEGVSVTLKPNPNAWYYMANDEWETYVSNMPVKDAPPVIAVSDNKGNVSFENVPVGGCYIISTDKDGYWESEQCIAVMPDAECIVYIEPLKTIPELPSGLELTVQMSKNAYLLGETIDYTLTLKNTTSSNITLDIQSEYPVKHVMEKLEPHQNQFYEIYAPESLTVPAGSEKSFEATVINACFMYENPDVDVCYGRSGDNRTDTLKLADLFSIKPGEHTLYTGLIGYKEWIETTFTVTEDLLMGTVSGIINTSLIEEGEPVDTTVAGATVKLRVENLLVDVFDASIITEWSAETGEDGSFCFTDVPVGIYYILSIEKEEYCPYTEYFVANSVETNLDLWIMSDDFMIEPFEITMKDANGLMVTMGTDRGVYHPDSSFTAFYSIQNLRNEPVTFTFEDERFVEWSIEKNDVYFEDESGNRAVKKALSTPEQFKFVLEPEETKEFTWTGLFEDLSDEDVAVFEISAELRYKTTSINDVDASLFKHVISVLVTENESSLFIFDDSDDDYIVDLSDTLGIAIDFEMDNGIGGNVLVTRMDGNIYESPYGYENISLYCIDTGTGIPKGMDGALLRIYYDSFDLGEDFDFEGLVIAHNPDDDIIPEDSALKATWEILDTRIDTENKYVEAYTTGSSEFTLMKPVQPTAVEQDNVVRIFSLSQNMPNPFNPATTIQFTLPSSGNVSVTVFNIMGQEVIRLVDNYLDAGVHRVEFDGSRHASGFYFYRVNGEGFSETKKMLLMK